MMDSIRNRVNLFTGMELSTFLYLVVSTIALMINFDSLNIGYQIIFPLAHLLIVYYLYFVPVFRGLDNWYGFIANWYPLILILFFYSELGVINLASGEIYDVYLQSAEEYIFGGQVSMLWVRNWPDPVLSWFLNISYAMYYFMVVGAPMLVSHKVGYRQGQHILLMIIITFYISYSIFLIVPTAGPLYLFPPVDNSATQTLAAKLVSLILTLGDAWGSAFPSCHVAVTIVLTFGAMLYSRRIGLFLLPFMLMLILATVYGQIHYAVDVLGGIVLAFVVLMFRNRLKKYVPE